MIIRQAIKHYSSYAGMTIYYIPPTRLYQKVACKEPIVKVASRVQGSCHVF